MIKKIKVITLNKKINVIKKIRVIKGIKIIKVLFTEEIRTEDILTNIVNYTSGVFCERKGGGVTRMMGYLEAFNVSLPLGMFPTKL